MEAHLNKDGQLVIILDFDKEGKMSASGKSKVHASTRGNIRCNLEGFGTLNIGVNAYSSK